MGRKKYIKGSGVIAFTFFALGALAEDNTLVQANRNVQVPAALVKELETWYLKVQHKLNPVTTTSDMEKMAGLKRQLLDLELTFLPQSGEALPEKVHFQLPTGGGQLDLANVIKGRRGGFHMQMKISKLPENPELRVFYLSGARRRTLQNEEYGAGCEKWAEITSWWAKHSHEPLLTYATDQRHVSVLAGTWLFAAISGADLWLGALTFSDSRWPQLQCDPAQL